MMRGPKGPVLVLVPHYYPAVKAGGPLRSVQNIVDELNDKIEFQILTSDRDLGDKEPLRDVEINSWDQAGNTSIYRLPRGRFRLGPVFKRPSGNVPLSSIYANSLFSWNFSILPLLHWKVGRLRAKQFLIAPRGELYPGALSLKSWKKKLYLTIARLLKLYDGVRWHATSEQEKEHIQMVLNVPSEEIHVAPNISRLRGLQETRRGAKKVGEARFVYISRITKKKGLCQAIKALHDVQGNVLLEVYGPAEDRAYWAECEAEIARLEGSRAVHYHGPIPNSEVPTALASSHVFVLPTRGENFGHAIVEALTSGLPVITSDQTPWVDLADWGAGHALEIQHAKLVAAMQTYVEMSESEYSQAADSARAYAERVSNRTQLAEEYAQMLALPAGSQGWQ